MCYCAPHVVNTVYETAYELHFFCLPILPSPGLLHLVAKGVTQRGDHSIQCTENKEEA